MENNEVQPIGVTQKTMATIADVVTSTINRAICAAGFSPIPSNARGKMRYSIEDTRRVLSRFISDKYKVTKKIQCFYNFKGGVGKTSICFQVASHLALCGFKVLVIDADPQGHLSTSFGFNNDESYCTLYDAIIGVKTINEVIRNIYDGLDCIPSNLSLTRTEVSLNEMPKREERVKILLQPLVNKYDFIIFDTNPTISYLNRNVLTCCDIVNIIVETQAYSLNGVKLLLSDIKAFCDSMMIGLPEIFMFPNKYEDRSATSAEAIVALNQIYPQYLMPNFAIRKSEEFNIASKLSKPLAFFCRNNSIAFDDVMDMIRFLINKSSEK
ncbi:MAG: AAA family ATPase [Alphaproteobacteria bacterium]|nr:AAA family ATPase [Alphaproteobacteria bacterium]